MNVAHLVSSGGLFGAERVMLSLAQQQNAGHDRAWVGAVRNILNPHLEVVEEAQKRGLPTFVVESKGRLDLGAVDRFSAFIHENKIDLVHSHNIKANVLGLLASKKTGVALLATNHLWTKADAKLRFYEGVDAFLYRLFFKRVVAVSAEIKRDMVAAGVSAEKIIVIPNGIEMPVGLSQKFNVPLGKFVLGVVARLSPEKGHKFLFEAIEGRDDLCLLVVGDGPDKKSLESRVANSKLKEKVTFTGYQKDMERIYAAIDILVQPSLREGLPMTLLEAMSRGKAVIATRVGGVPGLIKNGENGLLVDAGSSQQLAEAIGKLSVDSSLRGRLGENARKLVQENYSVEKMAAGYRQVYEEVLTS